MKHIKMFVVAGSVLFAIFIAGCGSGPVVVDKEASTSAISAAEAVGASNIPSASLYLQIAKEELAKANVFAENGDKEQAESMLLRAQSDGELAVALSRSDTDTKDANKAIDRVKQLQENNKLPQERN
jgi:outer membrane murein-binding lipoprotein Lpp